MLYTWNEWKILNVSSNWKMKNFKKELLLDMGLDWWPMWIFTHQGKNTQSSGLRNDPMASVPDFPLGMLRALLDIEKQ